MKPHAARALHQRLDDDAGDLLGVALQKHDPAPRCFPRSRGRSTTKCSGSSPRNSACMPLLRIAHRHRAGGVAVIAAPEGDEFRAPAHAAVEPVLHRHLHRDFDRDRAGIGEEHAVEIARQQRREPPRQRQRRLMHEPAEHHMRHLGKLPLDRRADVRVVVAVAGGPPRRDAVDQLAPVGEHDAAAVRARDRAAAAASSSSAHRAARRDRGRTPCGRLPCMRFLSSAAYYRRYGMQSLDDFAAAKARRARAQTACAARWSRPTVWTASGRCATAGGCCRSPATTISTSRQHPARQGGGGRGARALRRRLRRLAARHRQSSAVRRAGARLARLKGTEAACVFGSGYLANTGIIPALIGARRPGADRRTGACLPVGGRAAVARDRHAVSPYRRRRMSKPC